MTLPNPTPTPRQLLIEARALIAKPETWTQGTGARNAKGKPLAIYHPDAVSWSANGAIVCAMCRHADVLVETPTPLGHASRLARSILEQAVHIFTLTHCSLPHYINTDDYNDATNHNCILEAFDIAIADADRDWTQPLD